MRKLLTPSWLLRHLFALIILAMLIRLGFWQLERLAEVRAYNAAVLAAIAAPVIDLPLNDINPPALDFRRVTVTGVYDHTQSMVLRNKELNQRPGVHLLTPLLIAGSNQAVLIDRGWLPADQAEAAARAQYARDGEVTITGLARVAQPQPDAWLTSRDLPLPGEERIDRWYRVDIERMQAQVPYPLLPVFVEELPDPLAGATVLPRPEGSSNLNEGPHQNYALQWFTFAGILVIGYALLLRQEIRRPAPNTPGGAAQGSPSTASK